MAPKARAALDPIRDLKRRLERQPRSSRVLRATVMRWWSDHAFGAHPALVGRRIALALIEQQEAQAGVFVLHELLADHLNVKDLASFERLFAKDRLADSKIVDELAIKVLGTMLHRVRGRAELVAGLAQWRNAESVWQRRAACVAFTALAPQGDSALPNLSQQVFAVCSTVVWSPDRLDQTAVGWLLRELSRAEPTRVEGFVRRHARFMSRECARLSVDKLPAAKQQDLLAHWKRATTLSR